MMFPDINLLDGHALTFLKALGGLLAALLLVLKRSRRIFTEVLGFLSELPLKKSYL